MEDKGLVVRIAQQALGQEPGLQRQLSVLSQTMVLIEDAWHFLPYPDYWDTFLWLLDTSKFTYQVVKPMEQ